jgi:hypothetical protein
MSFTNLTDEETRATKSKCIDLTVYSLTRFLNPLRRYKQFFHILSKVCFVLCSFHSSALIYSDDRVIINGKLGKT